MRNKNSFIIEIIESLEIKLINQLLDKEMKERLSKSMSKLTVRQKETVIYFNLKIDSSSWIVARCFENQTDDNVRFAHTSPIFINVENKQFRMNDDALEWFISQLNQLILKAEENNEIDKTEQKEAIDLYEQAIDVFNKKMQKKYIQF